MGLNENQRRRIHAYLQHMEKSLERMEALIRTPQTGSVLYRVQTDLSSPQRRQLLALFDEMKAGIQLLSDRFGMVRREESLHRIIVAELSQDWTLLEDLYSRKLKGLGAVSADLKVSLDPEIEKLVDLLNRGFDIVREERQETSALSRGRKASEKISKGDDE